MVIRLLLILMLALAPLSPAVADTTQDSIIQQLREQGFERIELRRTLLGRVRILAFSDTLRREIVFNPSSGAILRDFWTTLSNRDDDDAGIISPRGGSGGGGSGDRDDDDDDDDDDNGGGDGGGDDDDDDDDDD